MPSCLRVFSLAAVVGLAATACAADAFYDVPIRDLKLVEGSLPAKPKDWRWQSYWRLEQMRPYAVLDAEGDAYVVGRGDPEVVWFSDAVPIAPERPGAAPRPGARVVIRGPAGKDIAGVLFVPATDLAHMVPLRFTVPAREARPEAKEAFYWGKIGHYEQLLWQGVPGGAWFRHQVRLARAELNLKPADERNQPVAGFGGSSDELTRTYDLFTGGRAMSENLQFDRALPPLRAGEKPVKVASIAGITIQEIDWKPLIKDAKPRLDPLAELVPADQHVVFFPSFQAAIAVGDETKQHDTPVLRLAQPRSENARIVERYQQQLGLPMSTIARLLGPKVAKSMALTGSDPFFPMGTDVAVLFETPQPSLLEGLLLGRIGLAAAQNKEAKAIRGEVGGLRYSGYRSPDRSMSSYVASLKGAVVVTNSFEQLNRLAADRRGEAKSIAGLPEYTFFRIRYPLGDPEETALVFLSDPTIRRWCGPRWRIADSRRTRAAAVMAELQASQLDALVRGKAKPGPIYTDLPVLGGGELTLTPAGVASSTYGTLEFLTPIAELPLDEVTQAEADAYRAWREGYQRNWNWAFDPIALRISLGKQKLAADMTVMPLIVASEYRHWASISLGGKFGPAAGDPHGALAHFILAINRQSPAIRDMENFLTNFGRRASLGWLGQSISIYADDDPFWDDLAKVGEDQTSDFLEKNLHRIPIAVRIEVSNPLILAAFLTATRTQIEQTAPGLTRWESRKYKEQPFVRITPATGRDSMTPRELRDLAICYTTVDGALTITLSEKVLQRAIDRSLVRKDSKAAGEPAGGPASPWLGSNAALRVDGRILDVANLLGRFEYQRKMQAQCWANLPILNEWKRKYPDRNPVEVHKRVWGVELVCPGGGQYVWNEKYRTLASTVYGHPGEPKQGPPAPPVLSSFTTGDFGLTFENQGVRTRAVLQREPKKPSSGQKSKR